MGDKLTQYINSSRREFGDKALNKKDLVGNPIEVFEMWLQDAIVANLLDPYAMSLATVDASGAPDIRAVYLRDMIDEGFVFYTNYDSAKATQLFANPNVTLNFLWHEYSRQVKIKGEAFLADEKLSDDYFASRPRESQLGAWASKQSQVLESRDELVSRFNDFKDKYDGRDIPRPEHWGGVVVKPTYFEFWQGRDSRLHDRIIYVLEGEDWMIKRLAP